MTTAATALNTAILTDALSYTRPDEVRAVLDALRKIEPVCYVEPEGIRPYWAVTRYEDVLHIESSPELFSAEERAVIILEALEKINLERFGYIMGVKTLVHMEGEQHAALRRVTRDWFMPANIGKLRGHVRELAASFIERMRDMGGECDFAADIAFWYPLRVVLQLIGVPEQDEAHILTLTQKLFGPEGFVTEEKDATAVFLEAIQGMAEYFTALAEDRRKNPVDDIASLLSNAKVNGELIDPFTLVSYFVILATAGHDTTSASIAGGMHALIQHPEQRQLLVQDPSLYPQAVDEIIRWVTPVKHFARTALSDTELGGKTIRKGDSVVMFFDSANRDDSVLANPLAFDFTKKGAKHMAFGHGRHNCLGMNLAKMEIDAMMRQLLPQLESIEMNGEPSYIPSHFVSGLSSLPVRYKFK